MHTSGPLRRARNRRLVAALAAVLILLVVVNIGRIWVPAPAELVLAPLIAVALVRLGRAAGLSWDDLGLARQSWRRGLAYAALAVIAVAAVGVVAAILPHTRAAFLDSRYRLAPLAAVKTALVVIPLGTVLLEEVAFRGVLFGLLQRRWGRLWGTGVSSVLFGLWHIESALRLGGANRAVGSVLGSAGSGRLVAAAGAVGFTALAGLLFCQLRHHSGSLLAAAGLHWATNGVGVLLAAGLWAARPG